MAEKNFISHQEVLSLQLFWIFNPVNGKRNYFKGISVTNCRGAFCLKKANKVGCTWLTLKNDRY